MSNRSLRIKAVGDVCFTDVDSDPFGHVEQLLQADLIFGNLECCLTKRDDAVRKNVILKASPSSADYLAARGFNLICLANNHSLDFGPEGLIDTLNALETRGLRYFGAGRNAREATRVFYIDCDGLRVAVLSAADASGGRADGPTIAWQSARALRDRVAEVNDADLVIVSYHAGIELDTVPSPFLIRSYRGFVDAGADIVLGHHPHVLQPVERYRDRVIAYSLGNFVFDNERYGDKTAMAAKTMILDLNVAFEDGKVVAVDPRYIPAQTREDREPHPLDNEREFTAYMDGLAAELQKVRADAVDVRRMDDLASEFHKKSLGTIVRYGVGHLRDFSAREILVGMGLVVKHALSRLAPRKK